MNFIPDPSRGRFNGQLHHYAVHVYYEDTDAGGVVYHANYLRWFERARTDMLRLLGIDQRAALDAGQGAYVVTDVALRFYAPARLGDIVVITSRLKSVGRATVTMNQIAACGEARLCEGTIKVGFVNPGGKPMRQPEPWREAFMRFLPEPER